MSTAEPPPVYSATPGPRDDPGSSTVQPPSYTFPTRFEIGGTYTQGILVDIPAIKGHLAMLNAFSNLKKEVEETAVPIVDMPYDKEKRWAWFVALAVERFEKWCDKLYTRDTDLPLKDTLPPVDVLMVWHSYMLNPRWYAEDGARLLSLKALVAFGQILGNQLGTVASILAESPTDRRVTYFETWIGLRFSPFDDAQARTPKNKEVECPKCSRKWFIPFMTTPGTGYLQQCFSQSCFNCNLDINHDSLCARKLAENLSRQGNAPDAFLPGTFFTDSSAADQKESDYIRAAVRTRYKGQAVYSEPTIYGENDWTPSPVDKSMVAEILEDCKYSVAEIRAKLGRRKLLPRIMSAHSTHMIYSVDLVGAVLRQGSFVKKMADLGWTRPGFFTAQDDENALRHAIARYHAFLDLLSSSPASFFVPTLDIDLVWHTHQLNSWRYGEDCRRYVGRFIDHDDKVDGVKLSSSFDLTCRAWKDRFKLPYTYCGCPLPGDTIGQRLSRFLSSLPAHPPSQLVPPSNRADLFASTHASEHNSVQFKSRNKTAWRVEQYRHSSHRAKHEKRLKREQGKERKKEREEIERQRERDGYPGYGCMYGQAFLMPVPMYYGTPIGGGVASVVEVGAARADVGVEGVVAGALEMVVVAAAGATAEEVVVGVDAEAGVGAEAEAEEAEVVVEVEHRPRQWLHPKFIACPLATNVSRITPTERRTPYLLVSCSPKEANSTSILTSFEYSSKGRFSWTSSTI